MTRATGNRSRFFLPPGAYAKGCGFENEGLFLIHHPMAGVEVGPLGDGDPARKRRQKIAVAAGRFPVMLPV